MRSSHRTITDFKSVSVNVQFSPCVAGLVKDESDVSFSSIFKSLGYSPACVASVLTSCKQIVLQDYKPLLLDLKRLLPNITCENKAISVTENTSATDLEQINIIINEINSLEKETKTNIEELKTLIHDAKNILVSVHKLHYCSKTFLPDGVTTVYPYKRNASKAVGVSCDQTTDGGGWTVIQNRDSAATRQDFNRSWDEYVEGFGDVEGEFWLGLNNIHALTKLTPMELRIDLEDYDGVKKWAKYDFFKIGDASTKYVLTLGKYSGDAGNSLIYHNGMKFSTYDQDNDKDSGNCALNYRGGWWFNNCGYSRLNGYQHVGKTSSSHYDGIVWYDFRGWNYSLKKASMKIRPKLVN